MRSIRIAGTKHFKDKMSDSSIFGNQNNGGADQPPANQGGVSNTPPQNTPNYADLLMGIKNEDGQPKYRTVEDALKALQHSQSFIDQLKNESATARAEAEAARAEAARVAEIERSVQKLIEGQNQPPVSTTPQAVDENAIAALVQRTLAETQQKTTREQNLSTVVKKLQERFGAEADVKFYSKAQELGFTKAEINDLAAKSPAAVFQLIGITETGKPQASPFQSSFNTSGFSNTGDTYVKANTKSVLLGATSQEVADEASASRKMVDELHAQGKSIQDLTNPRVYFQHFKR